jgi:protein-S-isoprenylcysteine O-methyltransferase Ste14
VNNGVYRMTRNPMYLGGALLLAGWALFYGSLPVGALGVVFVCGLNVAGIPFEERLLHRRFGDSYEVYRRRVPRWLGVGS